MTAGAVTLSSTAAVFSPQLSSLQSGCSRNMGWILVIAAIITFLGIGIAIPAQSHSAYGGTLASDAVGNLFLGLSAVTTGFVLGQDKVSNAFSGSGIWVLAFFLFGTGAIITSVVPMNSWGYTYQWGNVGIEMGGAVLACALGKTIFGGNSSDFMTATPGYKILFLIIFLGCATAGGYMGNQLTDPGWGALSSFLLSGSGACLAAVAEDLITRESEPSQDAEPNRVHNSKPAGKSHNSGSYLPLPFYDGDSARKAHYSDSGNVSYEEFRGLYSAYKAALDSSATDVSYKAYKQKQKERWSTAAAPGEGMAEVDPTKPRPRRLASSESTSELISGETLFLFAQLLILSFFVIGYYLIRRIRAIAAKRARRRALEDLELDDLELGLRECHHRRDSRETGRVQSDELF